MRPQEAEAGQLSQPEGGAGVREEAEKGIRKVTLKCELCSSPVTVDHSSRECIVNLRQQLQESHELLAECVLLMDALSEKIKSGPVQDYVWGPRYDL